MTRYFYKIAVWNANGLSQHRNEIELFLNEHKIDIMLISETHFTDKSYVKFPNYKVYTTAHPDNRAHGGSAVIIKSGIKHHECPEFKTEHIQATSICITDWDGELMICSIYCPPRHNIHKEQFDNFFLTLGRRFIVAGDFNAKHQAWGSRLNTPRGRELLKSVSYNHLDTLSSGEPTYWPSDPARLPDILDFVIVKGISTNYLNVTSNQDLSSDHTPIIVNVSTSVILSERPFKLFNKKTDWCNFRGLMDRNLNPNLPLQSPADIEDAIEYFNRTIQTATWQSTPFEDPKTYKFDYPGFIKAKIAEKRRLRRIWQYTRLPNDKANFNRATRELKGMLREFKEDSFNEYVQNLSATEDNDYSLWKATKRINQPHNSIPPLRSATGWARTDDEKACLFADQLEKRFQPHDLPGNNNHEAEVTATINEVIQPGNYRSERISLALVQKIVNELNPYKAPGYDFLTGKILQQLPRKSIRFLTILINAILRTGTFPGQWKVATVIMILKPGKPPNDVDSYRPISLLPIMSKVFERVLLLKLQPILNDRNFLPDHQFGFRQNHGTVEQVHRVAEVIRCGLEDKKYCSAVFLDVSQAFDRVWHPGLLYKIKSKLPVFFFVIIKSYLEKRSFQVRVGTELSSLRGIKAGVPQGSVLGPVLYTIFTSDLPTSDIATTSTFADDTAITTSNRDPAVASLELQQHLNQIEEWLSKWKIKVNEGKSTHVTFTTRRATCPPVSLNGKLIPQATEVRYLGIHLDRGLTWKKHVQAKRTQLNLKFSKMYWLLGRNSRLSVENKLIIYKSILKPVWVYGIQLWGTTSNSNLQVIQRFQSKTLRTILNAPWYINNDMIHRDLQMKTVKGVVSEYSERYLHRLENHVNPLAVNLLDNSEHTFRLRRATFLDLPFRFL